MSGAHVKITAPHPERGVAQVFVNGVDVSNFLMVEPFVIDLGDRTAGRRPTVTVAIACDPLEIDLPEALLDALSVKIDEDGSGVPA